MPSIPMVPDTAHRFASTPARGHYPAPLLRASHLARSLTLLCVLMTLTIPQADPAPPSETWALSMVHRHVQLQCATFLTTTQDDHLVVATFNNSNTTGIINLWLIEHTRREAERPKNIFTIEVPAYRGFTGLATAPDGSILAAYNLDEAQGSRVVRLDKSFNPVTTFGNQGTLELPLTRTMGIAIHEDKLILGIAWGRLQIRALTDGKLLGESPPPPDTPDTAEDTPVAVPEWLKMPIDYSTATLAAQRLKRFEGEPRIRDITIDPITGNVFGVGSDRVYSWRTNSKSPNTYLPPQLLIEGSGPVLPAQGIHFDQHRRRIIYASNQQGTVVMADLPDKPQTPLQPNLFRTFQATGPSLRAADIALSNDGNTLYISDLSGTISEFHRRNPADTKRDFELTQQTKALENQDLTNGQQTSPTPRLPSASELFNTTSTIKSRKPTYLILFTSSRLPETKIDEEFLRTILPRLKTDLHVAHCDVTQDRQLLMKYSIFVTPTILILDGLGQEITRHEGPLSQQALSDILRRTSQSQNSSKP